MRKRLLFTGISICCSYFQLLRKRHSELQELLLMSNQVWLAPRLWLYIPHRYNISTTTRTDGRFNLPNVRIGGPYKITVTYVGYTRLNSRISCSHLGQEYKADFALVPETKQLNEVTVTNSGTGGKVFNSSHTGNQEIITRQQLEQAANRESKFTRFYPSDTRSKRPLHFGGQSNQYNNITVDGANFNNSFGLSGTLGGQTNSQPIST